MSTRPTAHDAVVVELSSFKPPNESSSYDHGDRVLRWGSSGHRGLPDEFGDGAARPGRSGVTVLGSRNPYPQDPPDERREGAAERKLGHGAPRGGRPARRHSYEDSGVSDDEDTEVVQLDSWNPFGPAVVWQSGGDRRNSRPFGEYAQEDGGISDDDGGVSSDGRGASHSDGDISDRDDSPSPHHSGVSHDESTGSGSDESYHHGHESAYRHRSRSDRRYSHHYDQHYHTYQDVSPLYDWHPPFAHAPIESLKGIPARTPRPALMDQRALPIYATVPQPRHPLDYPEVAFPALCIPPPELLAELQRNPLETIPASAPDQMSAQPLQDFVQAFMSMGSDLNDILPKLKPKNFSSDTATAVMRKFTTTVQLRFAERRDHHIFNRVHVVPRGRLALGIVYAPEPELDVDLVLPSDFLLRRWNPRSAIHKHPCTIADALGLDPVSISQAEVEAHRLGWVLDAVWEQLNGTADGSIFPGGSDEATRYLLPWCTRYDVASDLDCLALDVTGTSPSIRLNVFVKVAVSIDGRDMIVGVDQCSTRIGDTYQLLKVVRTAGVPLSEDCLSHADRTAMQLLNWWRDAFSRGGTVDVPGAGGPISIAAGTRVPSSFIYLGLVACQGLDVQDERHMGRRNPGYDVFSGGVVLDRMSKVLRYLGTLSSGLPRAPVRGDKGRFPLASCTIMDTLYSQISEPEAERHGRLIDAMLKVLEAARNVSGGVSQNPMPQSVQQPPEPLTIRVGSTSRAAVISFSPSDPPDYSSNLTAPSFTPLFPSITAVATPHAFPVLPSQVSPSPSRPITPPSHPNSTLATLPELGTQEVYPPTGLSLQGESSLVFPPELDQGDQKDRHHGEEVIEPESFLPPTPSVNTTPVRSRIPRHSSLLLRASPKPTAPARLNTGLTTVLTRKPSRKPSTKAFPEARSAFGPSTSTG